MSTWVRSGRGLLLRALVALLAMGATFDQGLPRTAGAAQVAGEADVADLQAMTLTAEDLADEGLEGYGQSFGETVFPDQMIALIAEARGLDEDEVADVLEETGFARRYDSYLSLPDEDDPTGPFQRQVVSYVLEFDDEDGAEEAFAFLEDESDNPAAEDVRAEEVGDESEATRDQGEDPQIDLTFRLGNFHAGVAIIDWQGEEPDVDDAEALAQRLLERIEATLEDGGPGLGAQVVRLTGDGILTSADYYLLRDGDALTVAGEARADVRDRSRAAADIGQTDGYRLWQQLFAGDEDPGDDVWYQVVIARYDDEDAASDWLAGTEDRFEVNQASTNPEFDDDAPTAGDESIFYAVETEDGAISFQGVVLRVDATLAIIDLSGPEPPPAAAIETLAEAQAECLDNGSCLEPLALPDELDEYIEDLGEGRQAEDDEDEGTFEAAQTPETDDDAEGTGHVPMFRADPARTGVLTGPGPDDDPELRWSFDTGDGADSGAELWSFGVASAPTVAGGLVCVGSDDAFYAVGGEGA